MRLHARHALAVAIESVATVERRRFTTLALVALAAVGIAATGAAASPFARFAGSRCLSSLHARLSSGVAAGSIGDTVTLTNVSARTCMLRGYFGVQMLTANGHRLATHIHRGASVTVPATAVHTVTLAPRGRASFYLGYADATGYELLKCPTSARVAITPPNATNPITVPWHLQPYGGSVQHLRCGIITVSPVFAGT